MSAEEKETGAEMKEKQDSPLTQAADYFKEEQIFEFAEGLPAFEDARQFVFVCNEATRPFVFMRSLDVEDLGFVCIDPFIVCPDYKPRISDADTEALGLESPADVLILTIVTANADVKQTTTNLQGPLVINMRTRQCRQVICDNQKYPVRYNMWEAMGELDESVEVEEESKSTKDRSAA